MPFHALVFTPATTHVGEASFLQRLWELAGALHPATVHFPIAAVVMAALALLLAWKYKGSFEDIAFFCLMIAAMSSLVAAVMGWALAPQHGYSGVFATNTHTQVIVLLHRWGGSLLAILLVVTAVLAIRARRQKLGSRVWKAGTLTAAALAALVGHWGGSLTHGDLLGDAVSRLLDPESASSVEHADTPPESAGIVEPPPASFGFDSDIRPILERSCLSCHGPAKQKSGYRLDAKAPAFAGGEIGQSTGRAAIVPGESHASQLFLMISATEDDFDAEVYPMPPKADQRLDRQQIEAIRSWIDAGAAWPEGLVLESSE